MSMARKRPRRASNSFLKKRTALEDFNLHAQCVYGAIMAEASLAVSYPIFKYS